jgi:diacylglycerol kinase family enzyme
VLISVNPIAGRGSSARRVDRLAYLLRREGVRVEVSTDLAAASQRANHLHAEKRLRALVGVGGDGTAAELANRTAPGVPLTFLPAGTSNLSARQLGLSPRPEDALRTIMAGKAIQLDAGVAGGRVFLAMLGCGFDADVVDRLHAIRARSPGGHISYWTYLKPILRSIRTYQYPEIRIQCPGLRGEADEHHGACHAARWVFAFNLPQYGWGVRFAPQADGSDGLLDLLAFSGGGFWSGLKYLAAIELGRATGLSECLHRQVQVVRLVSDEPVRYQLDGDPGGWLPVTVEVLPGRVTVMVPPE